MKSAYVTELMDKLERTEVWQRDEYKYDLYEEGIQLLLETFVVHKKKQSKILFIGNGGSAAIASHMTADYMKNGGMNTYNLYNSAVITCMGNDYGYEYIFSRPMEFLVKPGDLIVAISSSGNSPNICNAIETAKRRGAGVISFTGFQADNRAKQLGHINVYVPSEKYGIVESIHNLILQQIVDVIMEKDGIESEWTTGGIFG